MALVKPRLRGVFHQYGFLAALGAGTVLVIGAPTAKAALAAAVDAASVCALLGVSALYHRITWTPPVRRWLRHLDHAGTLLLVVAGIALHFAAITLAVRAA